MIAPEKIKNGFPFLDQELLNELSLHAIEKDIDAGIELMREGQHVKLIPLVISGLVKVFSRYEDKELLLYYIQPNESCIMSFIAGLHDLPSKIFAVTEEKSTLALLPVGKLDEWIRRFPRFNIMFYDLYSLRYADMLDTIHQLVFEKLDYRLMEYLKLKSEIAKLPFLNIRHHEIAKELGTSREVVTRLLRKLEKEKKLKQQDGKIWIL